MITYNLEKTMNHIMWIINLVSTWGSRLHSDGLKFLPHMNRSYVNILVMLSVINFIPDRRSSKTSLHVLTRS